MSKRLLSTATIFVVIFNCSVSLAQVQVVDAVPGGSGSAPSASGARSYASSSSGSVASSAPADVQTEMYNQLQVLRQEVQDLRGLVEEQTFEINRLKQQRLDDYMNVDRRLSAISGGAPTSAPKSASAVGSSTNASTTSAPAVGGEKEQYIKAFQLVKDKNYDEAIKQYNLYLQSYPQGRYEPNVQYWLGEIYLLKGGFEQSRKWFSALIDTYPQHDKIPDAKYKLGTVYHKLGNVAKAKSLLTEVAATDTNAARLARDYLAAELP